LERLLDQELSRLPEKYRLPIVLCDLEGKPRKAVAHQLGWPEGTLSGRLTRARRMLMSRLRRRGILFSAGSLVSVLSQQAGLASVPPSLAASTIKVVTLVAEGQAAATGAISVKVAALAEGVLRTMFANKLKAVLAVLLVLAVCLCGIGTTVGLGQQEGL